MILLPVKSTFVELVTDDERCHCGAGSGTRPDSDTGGVRSKHARLIGAEGALAGYIHNDWRGVHFKPVIDASYWGISDSYKHITTLRVGSQTQS